MTEAERTIHDQLELRLRMPWNGYDPRSLTKGSRVISFRCEGAPRPDPAICMSAQRDLFLKGNPYAEV